MTSAQAARLQAASSAAASEPPQFQQSIYKSRRKWPIEEIKEQLAKAIAFYNIARERYFLTFEDTAQWIGNNTTTDSSTNISNSITTQHSTSTP